MELYAKYGYAPDKEAIARHLELIASGLEQVVSNEVLKECFSIMDLTTLSPKDTPSSVRKLVEKVNSFAADYPAYPLPASVCVYPNFASVVRKTRKNPNLHVTTVAGCFPSSQSFLEVKLREIELAVREGADEIDIVLALNSFLEGDYETAGKEILASGPAPEEALLALAEAMDAGSRDVILVFAGEGGTRSEMVREALEKRYPRAEVILQSGGQPVYEYILVLF